jgi:hypothetical protein
MNRSLLLALALSGLTVSAHAQDAIATRGAQDAPPVAAGTPAVRTVDEPTPSQAEAAEWGRQVLARANGQLPPSDDRAELNRTAENAKGCVRNPDRAPHGSVGVSVGSGGYRAADVYMTQPIGDCGQISIGISTSRGGHRFYGGPYGGFGGGFGPY